MSLQTRLTSLIQAVGADIKSLRTDVGLINAAGGQPKALTFYVAAAQVLGAGNPIVWSGEAVDTANIRNADLSSIILPAGTWWISANVRPDTALSAGAFVQALLQVNNVTRSEGIGVQVAGSTPPRCTTPGITVVSDGTVAIRVLVYSSTTGGTFASAVGVGSGSSISAIISGGVKGDKGDVGGNTPIPLEGSHAIGAASEPAFQNSWSNFDATRTARFRKYPDGKVRLMGVVKGGASGTTAFTLPVGYQLPLARDNQSFAVSASGGTASVTVYSNGQVTISATGTSSPTTWAFLDGVEFDTELVTTMPAGPQGPQGIPGGNATVPMDTWHAVGATGEPAFNTAQLWQNLDGAGPNQRALRFTKSPLGRVYLTGVVKGNNNTIVFTLPAGYRPVRLNEILNANASGGNAQIVVSANGDVSATSLSGNVAAYVSFDGLSFDTELVTQMPTGPQGPKGDLGGTMGAAGLILGVTSTQNGSSPKLPLGPVVTEEPLAFFTRNADQSISVKEAGWYTFSVSANTNQSLTANTPLGMGVCKNDVEIYFPSIFEGYYYGRVQVAGVVYLVPTDRLDFRPWNALVATITTWSMQGLQIARLGGPQGPKGDPGGIGVLKTLNWNTAIIPSFYRSTNDGLEQTINGPGDTLNPPKQAGVVYIHESGQIVQKVWDLDMQLGHTRYRAMDGTWSAWIADLVKPLLVPDVMFGGNPPQEGDERYFQNTAMKALGIVWKFRYNKNSTSAYKWEFVGGPAYRVIGNTVYSTAAAAYVDVGVNLALPLSGDYQATTFGRYGGTGAAGSRVYSRLAVTSGNVSGNDMVQVIQGSTSNDATDRNLANEYDITNAPQGALLKMQHGIQVANAFTLYSAFPGFSLIPVRVQL